MRTESGLDDRDLAVLLFTWQCRYATLGQLRRAFWPSAPAAAAPRLRALRGGGWLGHRAHPWLRERLLYFPTRAGNRELAGLGLLDPRRIRDVPPAPDAAAPALRHDLAVVDLRLALEDSGADGRTWVSDHELRIRGRALGAPERVPDGRFEFERRGRRLRAVLEYERVPYHRSKVPHFLSRIRDLYPSDLLLVVNETASRCRTFGAWVRAARVYGDAPEALLLCHRAAVASRGLDAPWVDAEGLPRDPGGGESAAEGNPLRGSRVS